VWLECGEAGDWCVSDDLANIDVFDGQLELGQRVLLAGLQPIDRSLLVARLCSFRPPYGIRILTHARNGDTLILGSGSTRTVLSATARNGGNFGSNIQIQRIEK
jgi:hypothetical protein